MLIITKNNIYVSFLDKLNSILFNKVFYYKKNNKIYIFDQCFFSFMSNLRDILSDHNSNYVQKSIIKLCNQIQTASRESIINKGTQGIDYHNNNFDSDNVNVPIEIMISNKYSKHKIKINNNNDAGRINMDYFINYLNIFLDYYKELFKIDKLYNNNKRYEINLLCKKNNNIERKELELFLYTKTFINNQLVSLKKQEIGTVSCFKDKYFIYLRLGSDNTRVISYCFFFGLFLSYLYHSNPNRNIRRFL